MEISTSICKDKNGEQIVGLRVQESDDDPDPVLILIPPDIARDVAFTLAELADELDPPAWRRP